MTHQLAGCWCCILRVKMEFTLFFDRFQWFRTVEPPVSDLPCLCVCIGTVEPFLFISVFFFVVIHFFFKKKNMQKRAIPTPPLAQQIIKYRLKVQNLSPVPTVHVGIHNVVKALYLLVFSCSISIYLTSTIPSIFFKCRRPVSSSPASSNNKQQSTTKQTNIETHLIWPSSNSIYPPHSNECGVGWHRKVCTALFSAF